MKILELLNEGGHAIENTVPLNKEMYPHVYKQIKQILNINGQSVPFHVIGSAGKKAVSSDVDVMVDSNDLVTAMGSKDLKSARVELANYIHQQGFPTSRTGVSVHVGIPVGDNQFVQVDIMGVENAESARHLHQHEYDSDDMKGSTIHRIWANLARISSTPDKQIMISPYKGLVNRETKELITADKDQIAKYLLDPQATANDLSSVNRMINRLSNKAPDKLAQLKDKMEDL